MQKKIEMQKSDLRNHVAPPHARRITDKKKAQHNLLYGLRQSHPYIRTDARPDQIRLLAARTINMHLNKQIIQQDINRIGNRIGKIQALYSADDKMPDLSDPRHMPITHAVSGNHHEQRHVKQPDKRSIAPEREPAVSAYHQYNRYAARCINLRIARFRIRHNPLFRVDQQSFQTSLI